MTTFYCPYYLPPLGIGRIDLCCKVDVPLGLGGRLLLVAQVGHEQLGESHVSCGELGLGLGSGGQRVKYLDSLTRWSM